MSLEIRIGARGPSALWEGRQLTSTYAPDREAAAWAEGLNAPEGAVVFVAGDPWGLAAAALEARGCRGIALLPGEASAALVPPGVRSWHPGAGGLETFLERIWDDWGPDAVQWTVWPAFERLAPDRALAWGRMFRDAFRTYQGSWLSLRHFGRRQWKNALRNLTGWERPARLVPGTRPIVVAASGPSLGDGWAALERHRDRFELWALPSSFEALVRRGLTPDAGVATDGGWYAREHLHRLGGTGVPVLAALSSAPDPELSRRPAAFFAQGHPLEAGLLAALPFPSPVVPAQGTVAVTALRLALAATTGPVYIAGLDLAFRGLRGHAAPHTVDRRAEASHDRLAPLESWWSARTLDQAPAFVEGVRTSPAMITYAAWLRQRWSPDRRVVRIAPSALRWPTMEEISWDEAEHRWSRTPPGTPVRWQEPEAWPTEDDRRDRSREVLEGLAARAAAAPPEDPWLAEAARTAAPEAVARGWKDRRAGRTDPGPGAEVSSFLRSLAAEAESW